MAVLLNSQHNMRRPTEDEQQLATFVLLDTAITRKHRLMATRMERGGAANDTDFSLLRELAQQYAFRARGGALSY